MCTAIILGGKIMKKMKAILVTALALAMIVALCACGKNRGKSEKQGGRNGDRADGKCRQQSQASRER